MSDFFENCRKEKKVKNKIEKLFPEKEIIFRNDGNFRHILLPPFLQLFFVFLVFAGICWGLYTSSMYFLSNQVIKSKETKITSAQNEYKNLLLEVTAYREKIAQVSRELEKNHIEALNLLKQNQKLKKQVKNNEKSENKNLQNFADNEISERIQELGLELSIDDSSFAKIEKKRKKLKSEMTSLENNLNSLSKGTPDSKIDFNDLEYKAKQLKIELGLLKNEKTELKSQVQALEQLVSEMQDTQIQVFDRVSMLADGGISKLEKTLKGIDGTMRKYGLSIEKLIKRERKSSGQGGPFIPAKMPDLKHPTLNKELVSLNDKVQRWDSLVNIYKTIPLGNPVRKVSISSPFGYRRDPFNGRSAFHDGVDLRGKTGDNVKATAPGEVVRAGKYGLYGNLIEIKHDLGFSTRYAHLDKIHVKKGDIVNLNDIIGEVGNTGRSTASHLHYEVRIKRRPVNPIKFVRARENVF